MAKFLFCVIVGILSVTTMIYAGPVPEEFADVAPGIRADCMNKTGATLDIIDRGSAGDFVPDEAFKCYLKCCLDQFRLISKKGINYDAFLALTPPRLKAVANRGVQQCHETTGKPDDLCDLAYNVVVCFYRAAPDDFFIM